MALIETSQIDHAGNGEQVNGKDDRTKIWEDILFFFTKDQENRQDLLRAIRGGVENMQSHAWVQEAWRQILMSVKHNFGVFDIVRHTEDQMELDFVSRNQVIYKVNPSLIEDLRKTDRYQNIVQQLCESGIFADLIRIASDWVGK